MLPTPSDPQTAALQALSYAESPALRAGAPVVLQDALARWPGHPDLLDTLLALPGVLPDSAALERRALVPLLKAQAALVLPQSAALLSTAAELARQHDNPLRAFQLTVAALEHQPRHLPARRLLRELSGQPLVQGALDDAMETLAFGAFRGEIDRAAVIEVFDLVHHIAPLRRARSLLGQ